MLSGLPPGRPAGRKVRVTVSSGSDGMIDVTALDLESGKQTTTQVSYRSGPSQQPQMGATDWGTGIPIE